MRTVVLSSFLAAATCIGCGEGTVPSAILPAGNLHGGVLVPLPENQGFVELLNGKQERRAGAYQTTIVAYLLQSDQKTAFAQKPTKVSVAIDTAGGQTTVPLVSTPEPGDPVGSTRFVSEPGPFELNQRGGEVSLTLDGKTLAAKFRGPR